MAWIWYKVACRPRDQNENGTVIYLRGQCAEHAIERLEELTHIPRAGVLEVRPLAVEEGIRLEEKVKEEKRVALWKAQRYFVRYDPYGKYKPPV